MTSDEIFTGLDDVPWAESEHCWGPAADTPRYLRNLRSASENERDEAQYELGTSIYHLGARYPATHLAVPFIVRIALAPDTADRAGLIEFLISLAIGYDTDHFPGGFDPDAQRKHLAELRAHTVESWEQHLDAWVAAAGDDRRRERRQARRGYWTLEGSLRSAESEVLAYEAVRAAVPDLRRLLTEDDPLVRAATAYLLGWFPEDSGDSVAALITLVSRETDSAVLINALIALGLLPGTPTAVIDRFLGSGENPIAWAAAAALVAANAPDEAAIARLGAALRSDPSDKYGLLYRYGEFACCASKCLAAVTGDLVPLAIDTAIEALSSGSSTQRRAAAQAAVALAFPDAAPDRRPPFAELDAQQQRVLRALEEAGPKPWQRNNQLDLLLNPHNLPSYYDDLRAYIETGAVTERDRI